MHGVRHSCVLGCFWAMMEGDGIVKVDTSSIDVRDWTNNFQQWVAETPVPEANISEILVIS